MTPVGERALALREGTVPVEPDPAFEPVDPLTDILAVLDDEARVRTQEVPYGLTERNPDHYRGWTFSDLKSALEPYGAAPLQERRRHGHRP
ncbi:hypothetical protein [Streptomyces sp. NPDC046909]|uniref:hypothetical protein n=1 Tax=Streptomyces sp. NPDC046909 TaxID=3155617 RepID=UPI0033E57A61